MCEVGMIFRQEQRKTEGLQFLSAAGEFGTPKPETGLRLSLVRTAQPSRLAATLLTSGMSLKAS